MLPSWQLCQLMKSSPKSIRWQGGGETKNPRNLLLSYFFGSFSAAGRASLVYVPAEMLQHPPLINIYPYLVPVKEGLCREVVFVEREKSCICITYCHKQADFPGRKPSGTAGSLVKGCHCMYTGPLSLTSKPACLGPVFILDM